MEIEDYKLKTRWVMVTPADVSGSRLSTPKSFGGCHATELATLQSGSPPGGGRWMHLQTFPGNRIASQSVDWSSTRTFC